MPHSGRIARRLSGDRLSSTSPDPRSPVPDTWPSAPDLYHIGLQSFLCNRSQITVHKMRVVSVKAGEKIYIFKPFGSMPNLIS